MQREDENQDRHPCRYERELWNKADERYDTGTPECHGLMKVLEKFHNYVYGVRFHVETDANTLVHQPKLPANDLPGAPVTLRITWIRMFDFDVKPVPGRLSGGPDSLSRRPRGEGEPEPEQDHDLEVTIVASLQGIRVKRGPVREEGESIRTICWVRTGAGIQREIEGDR